MAYILGIDAAWTPHGSSGVALVHSENGKCNVVRASASYAAFLPATSTEAHGTEPDAATLLSAAEEHCGSRVTLVAIDMPLSHEAIVARRAADNEISKEYGRMWAGTHSPTPQRPGSHGQRLQEQFEQQGYRLCVSAAGLQPHALIEVYPLAALVAFFSLECRPQYKVGKRHRYFRALEPQQRIPALLRQWADLREKLSPEISNLPDVPSGERLTVKKLKMFEDTLDAILCAWIGGCALAGRARWFGDTDASICVPLPG